MTGNTTLLHLLWYSPVILLIGVMGLVLLSFLVVPFLLGKIAYDARKQERAGRPPYHPEPEWVSSWVPVHKDDIHHRFWYLSAMRPTCDGFDCEMDQFGSRHRLHRGARVFFYRDLKQVHTRIYVDECADRERERYSLASDDEKYLLRSQPRTTAQTP